MAATVAGATLALLALYGAALIFLLQMLGDRYSPAIFASLLLRKAAVWVLAQVVVTLTAFALIAIPLEPTTVAIASLVLLVVALIVSPVACYQTWLLAADRGAIAAAAGRVPSTRRLGVVRELVWTAIVRSDVEMVHRGLRILGLGSSAQMELLNWLLGHHPMGNREWVAIELLEVLVEGEWDESVAGAVRIPLLRLLGDLLDAENYTIGYEVVHGTMRKLRAADPFTNKHGQLMLDIARSIWLVGDRMGDAPRSARVGARLDYLKLIYVLRRNDIFHTLLDRHSSKALTIFTAFLCLTHR